MSTPEKRRMPPRENLHAGRSLWADERVPRLAPAAKLPSHKIDVVVIGGGISGAITALVLSAAGYEVVVLDRRDPGAGSTIASTAMIQFELDTPLIELSKRIGNAPARRAYRRSLKAVRDLERLIDEHDLDARFVRRDALYIAGNVMGHRALEAEAEARRAIGLPSRYLPAAETRERFGIETTGAILSAGSAELDPRRTANACLHAAERHGATIVSPAEVLKLESADGEVTLRLKSGDRLTARKVVCATGYEVIDGIPRDQFCMVSSWAIATKPIAPESFWPTRCLIWEAADPYLYVRSTADDRILVGGEDSGLTSPARRARAIPAKATALLRKVSHLLGRSDLEIDYAWGGAFADSPKGLPVLRPLPDLPGVFAVLGCGGNGITFSVIAASLVKAWVKGRSAADADLFDGRRR